MQVLKLRGGEFLAITLLISAILLISNSVMGEQRGDPSTAECVYFGNTGRTNAGAKYVIEKPGRYCLTEDLHARIEFADHPAERSIIAVYAGDVVLDLQGHTLGRGRIFRNPGGAGVKIIDPNSFLGGTGLAKNIVIKNGVLQDFDVGIIVAGRWQSDQPDTPMIDSKTNTYYFPANNIRLQNITFKRNKTNFEIHLPPEP